MNPVPQPFAGQGRANGRHPGQRHSQDSRPAQNATATPGQNGHAPMAVPPRAQSVSNGHQPGFSGPRSPPNAKNTSHVPCKFFRQGTCQAGKACPFLHSEAITPCKYFQRGNCKFGLKCANDHITADGRRVNKPGGYVMGPGPVNLGGRVMPPPSNQAPGGSLLSMQQDHFAQPQPIPGAQPDYMNRDLWRTDNETGFGSLPKSNYGSPPAEAHLLLSPTLRGIGITAANAQLPASFDSQGVSRYAREGPFAASVPSRFGLDSSPPTSTPFQSSALRNLHSSAFGEEKTNGSPGIPSSPPTEENITRRILHSERYSRNPRMLSASVGARVPVARNDEDWDDLPVFEEDLVPNSLQELLTPQEKKRRYSRNDDDGRTSLSGLGTPGEGSKVGSPSMGASPSRYHGFWGQRKLEGHDSSPFGPVGSPLKNSSLHPGASPSLRATANARPLSGDLGPMMSPPRQASMSMISQQLQRTRLSDRVSESQGSSSPLLHPGVMRIGSASSASPQAGRLDRAVSSSSVHREKIDEEPEEGLFSMDEVRLDEAANGKDGATVGKRGSSGPVNAWANGAPDSGFPNTKAGAVGAQRRPEGVQARPNGV